MAVTREILRLPRRPLGDTPIERPVADEAGGERSSIGIADADDSFGGQCGGTRCKGHQQRERDAGEKIGGGACWCRCRPFSRCLGF